MSKQRALRIADEIKRLVSTLIQRDMKDPRIPPFTSVTDVDVTPDLSIATCYISVLGAEDQLQSCLLALTKGSGFLRREIARHIRLRVAPELRFVADRSSAEGERIDRLLDQALGHKKDRSAATDDLDHFAEKAD